MSSDHPEEPAKPQPDKDQSSGPQPNPPKPRWSPSASPVLPVTRGFAVGVPDPQFSPASGQFSVASIAEPTGASENVFEIDRGFTVSGTVTLPNWLAGNCSVSLYAEELGGPVNEQIKSTSLIAQARPSAESGTTDYQWSIPVESGDFPHPQPDSSHVYNLTVVFVMENQPTDVATFVDLGKYMIM